MFCSTPDAKEATSGARKPATVSGPWWQWTTARLGVCPAYVATDDLITFSEYPELVSAFSHLATDSRKLTNRVTPAAHNRHSPRVNASLTNSVNSKP